MLALEILGDGDLFSGRRCCRLRFCRLRFTQLWCRVQPL